jgi:hypothetical protein
MSAGSSALCLHLHLRLPLQLQLQQLLQQRLCRLLWLGWCSC